MSGAMADLRDQLLRAGLVDSKTKQQADTTARRQRKNKKKKKKKKKEQTPTEQDRQREAYETRLAVEALENRRREAARAKEREARELESRIANLAGTWAVRELKPGPRRFCFVTRQQKIGWFHVTPPVAWKLESGQLAIVERPGDTDEPHALVPARIAERIEQLDAAYVLFWNREPTTGAPAPGSPG